MAEVYAFLGNRGMELIPNAKHPRKKGITIERIKWIPHVEGDKKLQHWRIDLYAGAYKNKISRMSIKRYVLGRTFHKWVDPALKLRILLSRRVIMARNDHRLRLTKKSPIFMFSDGSIPNEANLRHLAYRIKRDVQMESDLVVGTHSFRVGLGTMMFERGLSTHMIFSHVGWKPRKEGNAASFRYIKLSTKQRAMIPRYIITKPIILHGVNYQ